jgi:hypothetical protein
MRLLIIALTLLIPVTAVHADAKSDAAIELRLKKARDAFTAAVESAKRRLRDEYDSAVQAYTRAGDLDKAMATRKSRDQVASSTTMPAFLADAERPDVDDGWTILFRSHDPLVWNVAIRNRTMTASPVSAAPANVRFLRMRRLDTNDAVIVPCTSQQLTTRTWPVTQPTFRGDRCLSRGGRALGIVDPRAPRDLNSTPIIDVTPNGPFAGWGFAIWEGNDRGQDYVWDSKVIPPTTFEIAVTSRDLSAEEQKLLVTR